MEQGDVILTVDGIPVTNPNAWSRAMKGKVQVRLRIRNVRAGPTIFRDVTLN